DPGPGGRNGDLGQPEGNRRRNGGPEGELRDQGGIRRIPRKRWLHASQPRRAGDHGGAQLTYPGTDRRRNAAAEQGRNRELLRGGEGDQARRDAGRAPTPERGRSEDREA